VSKPLALRSLVMETTLLHFRKEFDQYVQVLFESCGSSYAEVLFFVRHIEHNLMP